MEDDDVPSGSWDAYDPASTAVPRDPANATGVELPHLREFTRIGTVPASRTVLSRNGHTRVQILSDRVVRIEYHATSKQHFEDRASFCFATRGRVNDNSHFTVQHDSDASMTIQTDHMRIYIVPSKSAGLRDGGLSAEILPQQKEDAQCPVKEWPKRDFIGTTSNGECPDDGDLLGTCRTLDEADGYARRNWASHRKIRNVHLKNGLLSRRFGLVFIDDSTRPLFTDDGWFSPRPQFSHDSHYLDCYVLASGSEYHLALQAFTAVAGDIPLIPRRYLGNWWSRYHRYDEQELVHLVQQFQYRIKVPLSMLIIDMDWHLVSHEDNVEKESDGWTGYTWNKRLFPNPSQFISWVHARDIGTALNLHPAGKIHAHEQNYERFAEYMGASALATRSPIPFDPTDPMVASAYFATLIRPLEEDNGELAKCSWWLDWQQGSKSRMNNIDPLFLLNHLHFLDMARNHGRDRRPVIFSRYAGPGSHRTPIGFSGDTHASWESLAFQPYMTHTASNAAFPYWSHDIGGHTRGIQDDELYARWVQWGALSPILRLHSSNNPFCQRMPWAFGPLACMVAGDAMRLRHQLVPYLYSASWRTHTLSEPLMMPMYYVSPDIDDAYVAPAQYWFGRQLVAAPITSPHDPETGLSKQIVWLPPLDSARQVQMRSTSPVAPWRHLLSGEAMSSGWHTLYVDLTYIPLFAPPGAIVPMAIRLSADMESIGRFHQDESLVAAEFNNIDHPTSILLQVVAGGSGCFELYEDEEHGNKRAFLTNLRVTWNKNEGEYMVVDIDSPLALSQASPTDLRRATKASSCDIENILPRQRVWRVRIIGVISKLCATLTVDDLNSVANLEPAFVDAKTESVIFDLPPVGITSSLQLKVCSMIPNDGVTLISANDRVMTKCEHLLSCFNLGNEKKMVLLNLLPDLVQDVTKLAGIHPVEEVPDPTGTLFTVTAKMKQALLETIDGSGSGRNYSTCPSAPAVAWAGKKHDMEAELVVREDSGHTFVERLSVVPGQALIVRPGSNTEAFRVIQAKLIETYYPMRDPDDFSDKPSPVVQEHNM